MKLYGLAEVTLLRMLSIPGGFYVKNTPAHGFTFYPTQIKIFPQHFNNSMIKPKRLNTYVESWPNTTSAWAGWSRFGVPVDRCGGVTFPANLHQQYTGVSYLPPG